MNKKYTNNKGITLVAMVVTIIVLIALAGVTINLVLGENGVINKAKEQEKEQKKIQILETLELKKAEVAFQNDGSVPIDKYIQEIQTPGKMLYNVTRSGRRRRTNIYNNRR